MTNKCYFITNNEYTLGKIKIRFTLVENFLFFYIRV